MHAFPMLALAPDARLGDAIGSIVEAGDACPLAVADSTHAFPVLAIAVEALAGGALRTGVEPGDPWTRGVAYSQDPLT
jgi:hypothetical protein